MHRAAAAGRQPTVGPRLSQHKALHGAGGHAVGMQAGCKKAFGLRWVGKAAGIPSLSALTEP